MYSFYDNERNGERGGEVEEGVKRGGEGGTETARNSLCGCG